MSVPTPGTGDLTQYVEQTWVDVPTGTTPPPGAVTMSQDALNHMESGIGRSHLVAIAAWTLLQALQELVEDLPTDDDLAGLVSQTSLSATLTDLRNDLAAVARTGDYADLTGRPSIPTQASDIGAQPAGAYARLESGVVPDNQLPSRLATAALASAISTAVAAEHSLLVGDSPAALDTIRELAAAIGDDPNRITTLSAAIAAKYTKPAGGIPASDLAAGVVPDVSTLVTKTAADATYGPLRRTVQAQAFVSSEGSPYATSTPPPFAAVASPGPDDVIVSPEERYQTILGVGAALTDSAAYCLTNYLTAGQRSTLIADLYGPSGSGWSTVRICVGSSDFTSRPAYTYDDMPTGQVDPNVVNFSLGADREYIVGILREMKAACPRLRIIASTWSPPAWMQTGNSYNDTHLAAYATYLVKVAQAYKALGLPIWAFTPQNEPTLPSNTYLTTAQEITLLSVHLGPALRAAGLDTRILIGDDSWNQSAHHSTVAASSAALPYAEGFAWHAYSGNPSVMSDLRASYPAKTHHMTEMRTLQAEDWAASSAIMAGSVAVGSFRNWCQSVTLWNLALDQTGQPTPISPGRRGVVTVPNDSSGNIVRSTEYYVLRHIARHLQPGAVRVGSTSPTVGRTGNGIQSVAFLNPDGTVVTFVFNNLTASRSFQIIDGSLGTGFVVTLPGKTFATYLWGTSAQNSPLGVPRMPQSAAAPSLTVTGGPGMNTLTWAAPTSETTLAGYQLYRGTSAGTLKPYLLLAPTATSHRDLLGASGVYFYALAALNAAGLGASSATTQGTATSPQVPSAPVVTATSTSGAVTLTWAAPSPNGSEVTSFTLTRGTTSGSLTALTTLPKGSTSYTDTGLTNGTTYYYKLTATNATGTSTGTEVSATPNALTPATVDAVSTSTNYPAAQVNTLSWAHTVGSSSKRALLVAVSATSGTGAPSVSSVTYGGTALTKVNEASGGTNLRFVSLWRLTAPPSGAANVVVNLGTTTNVAGASISLAGVDQSAPLGTSSTAIVNANASPSITTTAADPSDLVLAVGCARVTSAPTAGNGQTQQYVTQLSGNAFGFGSTQPGASGSVVSSFALAAADTTALVAVPVRAG